MGWNFLCGMNQRDLWSSSIKNISYGLGVGEAAHFMANKVMKCPSDVKQNKQKGENEYR